MSWAMAKPEVQEVFEIHAAIWGALKQQHCNVKLACNTDDLYRSVCIALSEPEML